jgi:hypothetical protein
MISNNRLYTLIPLDDFKMILALDDREDALSRYCLTTATFTIEQYCKRRLLRKKHFEFLPFNGDYLFPLREYPAGEVLAVYLIKAMNEEIIVEPDLYRTMPPCGRRAQGNYNNRRSRGLCLPECGDIEDIPVCLSVSPTVRLVRDLPGLKVHYVAGYSPGKAGAPFAVPADLASACLELAAWNMSRYRGRRIGMTGAVRGSGKEGEHLEMSMPENVRLLLEPYKRRMI